MHSKPSDYTGSNPVRMGAASTNVRVRRDEDMTSANTGEEEDNTDTLQAVEAEADAEAVVDELGDDQLQPKKRIWSYLGPGLGFLAVLLITIISPFERCHKTKVATEIIPEMVVEEEEQEQGIVTVSMHMPNPASAAGGSGGRSGAAAGLCVPALMGWWGRGGRGEDY